MAGDDYQQDSEVYGAGKFKRPRIEVETIKVGYALQPLQFLVWRVHGTYDSRFSW